MQHRVHAARRAQRSARCQRFVKVASGAARLPVRLRGCRSSKPLARLATAAPFVLLSASTVLTAALAWQAFASAASHRQLTQRVLHDYAELAATEFSRRTTAYVGNYGVVIALRALGADCERRHERCRRAQTLQAAMPSSRDVRSSWSARCSASTLPAPTFVSEDSELSPVLRDALRTAAGQAARQRQS